MCRKQHTVHPCQVARQGQKNQLVEERIHFLNTWNHLEFPNLYQRQTPQFLSHSGQMSRSRLVCTSVAGISCLPLLTRQRHSEAAGVSMGLRSSSSTSPASCMHVSPSRVLCPWSLHSSPIRAARRDRAPLK